MRIVFLPVLVLAGAAYAAPPEQITADILEAYGHLRDDGPPAFTFSTVQTLGARTINYTGTVRWLDSNASGRDAALVEVTVDREGLPERRIVSDGRTVWAYDFRTNSYAALRVDSGYGVQSTQYRLKVADAISSFTPAPAADALRLAREIAGDSTGPLYRAWLPGVKPENGSAPQDHWAIFDLAGINPRNVTFEMTQDSSTGAIYFDRLTRYDAGPSRSLDVRVEKWTDPFDATSASFQFIPPTGARSLPPARFFKE